MYHHHQYNNRGSQFDYRWYNNKKIIKWIYGGVLAMCLVLCMATMYFENKVISTYKETHSNHIVTMVQAKSSKLSINTLTNTTQNNEMDLKSESRVTQGLKSKSRQEIKKIMMKEKKYNHPNLNYLLKDDINVEDQVRQRSGLEFPVVYLFRNRNNNLPFHVGEALAKRVIDPNAVLNHILFTITDDIDSNDGGDDTSQSDSHSSAEELQFNIGSQNYDELFKVRDGMDWIDIGMFDFIGEHSSQYICTFLSAFESKIRKTIIIVGHTNNYQELEDVIDYFLQSHRVWQVGKINVAPTDQERAKEFAVIFRLNKVERSSPTFQLFQHLDHLYWGTSPLPWLFAHSKRPAQGVKPPSCDSNKFIVNRIEKKSFGDITRDLVSLVTHSIYLNRQAVIDSTDYIYGGRWTNVYLPLSKCNEHAYKHDINQANARYYNTSNMNGEALSKAMYESKYLVLDGNSISKGDANEGEPNNNPDYPLMFGFNNYFEYEAAVINYLYRMNTMARKGYKLATFGMLGDIKKYYHPPQCIAVHIGLNQLNRVHLVDGRYTQVTLDTYLDTLLKLKQIESFRDIDNLFVMSDNSLIIDQFKDLLKNQVKPSNGGDIQQQQHKNNNKHDQLHQNHNEDIHSSKLFTNIQHFNYSRENASPNALATRNLTLDDMVREGIVLQAELMIASQCEVLVGTNSSSLDRLILQLTNSNYNNRPVFFYSIDGTTIVSNNNNNS